MRNLLFLALLTSLIPVAAFSQECISHTTPPGAVYGTAEFTGEPWTHTWQTTEEWDNDAGVWRPLNPPIENSLAVPGTGINIRFEDGSTFEYGAGLSEPALADNLSTIYTWGYGGFSGPYQAMRTAAGEVFLLDEEQCEQVSWDLARGP